jgi:inorganic pyrophosphatase
MLCPGTPVGRPTDSVVLLRGSAPAHHARIAESGHFAPDRGGHIPTTSDADDDPTDVLLWRAREGPKRSASLARVARMLR